MEIVSLAPYVPYEGVDHAGGEYLLRYLEVLHDLGHHVTLIVPGGSANRRDLDRRPRWLDILVGPTDEAILGVRAWRLVRHGTSRLPSRAWAGRLDAPIRAALARADVVDLQWMGSVQHASTIRAWNPRAVLIATPHDVYSESIGGAGTSTSGATRVVARLALPAVLRAERRQLSACDRVFVFKQADIATLARLGVTTEVRTTPPVVTLPSESVEPEDSQILVFAAAFWRDENDEAARWFLTSVFPLLQMRHPDAHVRFAGARPSQWLLSQASDHVEVTGYLPDLVDAYRGAQVAIAPLLRGAGLKFKVVQAIALGFPVVATAVAAEGVDDLVGAEILSPARGAEGFADAISRILQNWPEARDGARHHARLLADRLDFRRQVAQQAADYAELAGRP